MFWARFAEENDSFLKCPHTFRIRLFNCCGSRQITDAHTLKSYKLFQLKEQFCHGKHCRIWQHQWHRMDHHPKQEEHLIYTTASNKRRREKGRCLDCPTLSWMASHFCVSDRDWMEVSCFTSIDKKVKYLSLNRFRWLAQYKMQLLDESLLKTLQINPCKI